MRTVLDQTSQAALRKTVLGRRFRDAVLVRSIVPECLFVDSDGQDERDFIERKPRLLVRVEENADALSLERIPLVPLVSLYALDMTLGGLEHGEERSGPTPCEQYRTAHGRENQKTGG